VTFEEWKAMVSAVVALMVVTVGPPVPVVE
jgi:hypothetical protein